MSQSTWHVIWTTFPGYLPSDPKGDWEKLLCCYGTVATNQMSERLPARYLKKAFPREKKFLSNDARSVIASSIAELTASPGDRVAGQTAIQATHIGLNDVHLILDLPPEKLSQIIGRIKSRSATLLSFHSPADFPGDHTWSKGFWSVCLESAEEITSALDYVGNLNLADPTNA